MINKEKKIKNKRKVIMKINIERYPIQIIIINY